MFNYEFINETKKLREKVDKLYIYGAGFRGTEFYRMLSRNDIKIDGFIVTERMEVDSREGVPICEAKGILTNPNIGIVLGLSDMNTKEVVRYLKDQKVDFSRVVDGGKYMSEYRGTTDLSKEPFLEITTVIGCSVNCRFCPQGLLTKEYYKNDKRRVREMSIPTFQAILDHTPEDCVIMFAGMAEPYLNSHCTEMLDMACAAGRKVRLYTTLEGAKESDIDAILKMPLQFVGLHIADRKGFAHISTSEQYYRMVKKLIEAEKIGSEVSFLDDITAQGAPDEKIEEMCRGRFEIITAVQDRAGNLNDKDAESRPIKLTNEPYTCSYCGKKVNNHVALPDGTVLLCQMDYGMKHVLGNITKETYDQLREGKTMETIFKAMHGEHDQELLCDTCLYAVINEE